MPIAEEPPFSIGDQVYAARPEQSLRRAVGDLATVLSCYKSGGQWVIDVKWEDDVPRRGCRNGCYAFQFERSGGPW